MSTPLTDRQRRDALSAMAGARSRRTAAAAAAAAAASQSAADDLRAHRWEVVRGLQRRRRLA